ncbi:PID-CTERM protein-sorting domain-containing protein [Spirosoma pulveris]
MKKPYVMLLGLLIGSFASLPTNAQVSEPNRRPVNAPLDGGLSILLAAGAAVGLKKAHQKRKEARSMR